MPVTDAAKKAVRRDEKRTRVNLRRKRTMKEAIKRVEDLVSDGDFEEAKEALPEAQKAIDKAAKKNVIHENNAARKKSRLAKLVDQEGQK